MTGTVRRLPAKWRTSPKRKKKFRPKLGEMVLCTVL